MCDDIPPPGYLTLSYCWGPKPDNLKLCSHNKQQFEDVVPEAALPKSFMDAVCAGRRLGFDFLWIDSLCIVQEGPGSKENWLQHVKIMKLIYQNATLNLSADASTNANGGLFRHRNQRQVATPRVCITRGAFAGKYIVHKDFGTGSPPTLSQRGCVLQERLFSSRILHFGSEQLEWECNESSAISERYPYNLHESRIRSGTHSNDTFRMLETDSPKPQTDFLTLIMDYARCQLTYPALDKFAAFSAISEKFSIRSRQLYQAVFLEKSLPFSLLGHVERREDGMKPRQPPSSLTTFRAPSWSWASVDYPVDFYNFRRLDDMVAGGYDCIPVAHVQSLLVNPLDPSNPFGQLEKAEIVLAAPSSTCKWRTFKGSRYCSSLTVPEFPMLGDRAWAEIRVEFDNVQDVALPFDQVSVIAIYFQVGGWGKNWSRLFVLLLHRTSLTQYRRVGVGL